MLDLGTGEMIARVALAAALGGAIGLEREITSHPAGFRTHVVLALGAALFGLVSIHAFAPFEGTTAATNVRIDVTRVASQVVVGVGFLGAGAILRQPTGTVVGLTTAASLWVTAAIGLAVGIGYYAAALAVTVASLLSLYGLLGVRRLIRRRLAWGEHRVRFRLAGDAEPRSIVLALTQLADVDVRELRVERDEETGIATVSTLVSTIPGTEPLEVIMAPLSERDDVEEMSIVR